MSDILIKNGFVLFWNGIYSNWHQADMVIDGTKYSCVEQYMMASKAKTFDDQESLKAIMKAKNPGEQKRLGRNVKNFKPEKWDTVKLKIVQDATFAKFSQHPDLKEEILNIGK